VNAEQHAFYARRLVEACGGPTLAAQVARVNAGQLSKYGSVNYADIMPADVIVSLETDCGQRIYSRALFEATPAREPGELLDDACTTDEDAAALQAEVRRWRRAGKPLTPRERAELRSRCLSVRDDIDRTLSDLDAVQPADTAALGVTPIRRGGAT
jgi:hypothetical protein